ncbi:type II secretion system protein GspM [Chitinimonas naiadis]
MNAALLPLQTYWKQRNARERAILTAGAVFLLLALIYALMIDPINTERNRLSRSLPTLRTEVARFERDLLVAKGQQGGTVQHGDLNTLLLASGLNPQSARLDKRNGKSAALHASAAPWNALTNLMTGARDQGWQLSKLSVRAGPEPGLVDADLEWTR